MNWFKNKLPEKEFELPKKEYELSVEEYQKIYNPHYTAGVKDYAKDDNGELSQILFYVGKCEPFTKYDHHIAYERFFGSLRNEEEYKHIQRLVRDEELKAKMKIHTHWFIYSKIIEFYEKTETI